MTPDKETVELCWAVADRMCRQLEAEHLPGLWIAVEIAHNIRLLVEEKKPS